MKKDQQQWITSTGGREHNLKNVSCFYTFGNWVRNGLRPFGSHDMSAKQKKPSCNSDNSGLAVSSS